jgi:hypothetical protein
MSIWPKGQIVNAQFSAPLAAQPLPDRTKHRGGVLDFDLPVTGATSASATRPTPRTPSGEGPGPEPGFLTEAELERRVRENLLVILQTANWKIKGADGMAELPGVKPTTLFSRMRKMGVKPCQISSISAHWQLLRLIERPGMSGTPSAYPEGLWFTRTTLRSAWAHWLVRAG